MGSDFLGEAAKGFVPLCAACPGLAGGAVPGQGQGQDLAGSGAWAQATGKGI